jgi:DNA-binding NtrC family response regulator
MVVEDETLIRMMLVDVLADQGFEIFEADDADQAISLLKREAARIHVLFTNVRMPGSMDGIELAHYVNQHWPGIAVLVASGHTRLSNDQLPEGIRFIPKPYDSRAVVKYVKELAATT